jgi:hypothetical protein
MRILIECACVSTSTSSHSLVAQGRNVWMKRCVNIGNLDVCMLERTCVGLARTVYSHRKWACIWWFPCQNYRAYIHRIYMVLARPVNETLLGHWSSVCMYVFA